MENLDNEKMIQKVSQFYKAISDPTRLKIVFLLQEGECNVGTIVEKLAMEQSAVSHQLRLLRTNHLVKSRREGKTIYYSLDDDHVLDILSQTVRHVKHTDNSQK